jgi:hypothetical protein
MAIVQISRIQIRRGLNQDLPQLASAEMGWSVDTQQLYIGNGTLAEGAPQTGVTQILTTNSLGSLNSNLSALAANIASIQANVTAYVNTVEASLGILSPTVANLAASSSGNIAVLTGNSAVIRYNLIQANSLQRTGQLTMSRIGNSVYYHDDYTETATSDIVLSVVSGNVTTSNLAYTTTSYTTITYIAQPQ